METAVLIFYVLAIILAYIFFAALTLSVWWPRDATPPSDLYTFLVLMGIFWPITWTIFWFYIIVLCGGWNLGQWVIDGAQACKTQTPQKWPDLPDPLEIKDAWQGEKYE